MAMVYDSSQKREIAIIGMSGQFSKSKDLNTFWHNIRNGQELLHFYTDNELREVGYTDEDLANPNFIKVDSQIGNIENFDYAFFGFSYSEAKTLDPQTRLSLQHIYSALEDAAYNPLNYQGKIGLFASASDNISWRVHTHLNPDENINPFLARLISDKHFLTLIPSYKLNLRGPSFSLESACSSSLVAIHQACRSLLFHDCSISIAAGVRVSSIKDKGYIYEEGLIYSKDGHCRPFDANASGTIDGEGIGVVVLKRLNEAMRDGDHIYAIIKSTFVNNDGNMKVGFTAPSLEGQVECIRTAQKIAGITPQTVTYIEAHGTGTALGDPIEIHALNKVFGTNNGKKSCAVGSVKSNIGHLDAAAGIAGLIKVAMALKYREIPPSLNYKSPNPEIDFENGPFYVVTELTPWHDNTGAPLRAGVSSYGIGGTNAHAVLEECPEYHIASTDPGSHPGSHLLLMSAKTENSLNRYIYDMYKHVENDSNLAEAAVAFTMATGRQHFSFRRSLVFNTREDLLNSLRKLTTNNNSYTKGMSKKAEVIFMFPGQGNQYPNMTSHLYKTEHSFRQKMDEGFTFLQAITNVNFKSILFPEETNENRNLADTYYTQPLIFLVEASLAYTLLDYGISPTLMIGHSLGEYVAACISGVITFEDCLTLVSKRAELMANAEQGVMLSASLSEEAAKGFLDKNISLGAVNGPREVVFSGTFDAINVLQGKLRVLQIPSVKLNTSHAFHSFMQDSILDKFRTEVEKIKLGKPNIPIISNFYGKLISGEEYTLPEYWVAHLRGTVRFSDGIKTILEVNREKIFIEVGAGRSLSNMLRTHVFNSDQVLTVSLLAGPKECKDDESYFMRSIGYLWESGLQIDWLKFYEGRPKKRVSLPTYSFDSYKFPVQVNPFENIALPKKQHNRENISNWLYRPQWCQAKSLVSDNKLRSFKNVLIFAKDEDQKNSFGSFFQTEDMTCINVYLADEFNKSSNGDYEICAKKDEHYKLLFDDLALFNFKPSLIFHLWNFEQQPSKDQFEMDNNYYLSLGYFSLLTIAKNLSNYLGTEQTAFKLVGNGWFNVVGNEIICPIKSTALGALKVISVEFQNISCQAIEIVDLTEETKNTFLMELYDTTHYDEVAIRGKKKYVKKFERIHFEAADRYQPIKKTGMYLITGYPGAMANILSNFLVDNFQADLILLGRSNVENRQLETLRRKGSKATYIQTNLFDHELLAKEIGDVERTYGKTIRGVIHAAGVADFGGAILLRNNADDEAVFASKIFGTQTLHYIFSGKQLDFFVHCSSQAATLGPFGEVAYVSSNIFLDAIAESENTSYPVISIQWTVLQKMGMAAKAIKHLDKKLIESRLNHGIDPSVLPSIFMSALVIRQPVIIVSKYDFSEFTLKYKQEMLLNLTQLVKSQNLTQRNVSNEYVIASSDSQKKLVEIFENFFSMIAIGIEDDFAQLGIDSLKSMILLRQINEAFKIQISFKTFFENQTIKALSLIIDTLKDFQGKENITDSSITF